MLSTPILSFAPFAIFLRLSKLVAAEGRAVYFVAILSWLLTVVSQRIP
jgi:hypothetical protein